MVIGEDGAQLGTMPTWKAQTLAREKGLDLVEVNPASRPPVCKIMDYGKLKYDEKKNKVHRKIQKTKEVGLRPQTDDHDFNTKVSHIREFLEGGDKVQVTVQFRGRAIVHPEEGRRRLQEVIVAVKDIAKIDLTPSMEGRKMILILSPMVRSSVKPGINPTSLPTT
jgi:translation initiation factor IF-3